MSKRASTQDSVALAFELLKRIPRSYQITARELHQQLQHIGIDRDLRTIQRNLEMLCAHFDIIRDDRNKPYGYRWSKHAGGLALPTLSAQDALLLSLAEQYLSNLLPANLTHSFSGFFEEARQRLSPVTSNTKEREWLQKVKVVSDGQPLLPPQVCSDVFKSVSEALFHNRLLNIEYHNAKQDKKSGLVMPLGLAQQGTRLYLVCRFDGYENERSVAIHRVTKATVSTFNFERPKDFKLSQYDADGRFGFGEGNRCKVKFSITKSIGEHLLESPLSLDQQVQVLPQYYVISATVVESLQLKRWLAGFGDDVHSVEITSI
ncbi:helix-turn-helix transcriptional regulator [Vibrio renipiscarius]|uniref:helix-turn-helix transcriptional regulator n=1 Tax=Vibrio renipiscarius TaxID=1461322 RepID=UPI00354EDA13